MRRIAVINQKGGVGKTTTSTNLGAALAEQGRRVVVVDMDPQANLSLHLGFEVPSGEASTYTLLCGQTSFGASLRETAVDNLRLLPANIDLSGAELELASAIGREGLLRDVLEDWVREEQASQGAEPADYVLFDCPPSLGLLSINALAAAGEVLVTVQTEFLALQGMSKLMDVVALLRRKLNPTLTIAGIVPCLYDSRLRLAREVLAEMRSYFPGQVFRESIRANVKLAEAPSFGQTILAYAPDSKGALDHRRLALAVLAQEERHPELAGLPAPRPLEALTPAPAPGSARGPWPGPAARTGLSAPLAPRDEDGLEPEGSAAPESHPEPAEGSLGVVELSPQPPPASLRLPPPAGPGAPAFVGSPAPASSPPYRPADPGAEQGAE